MKKTCLFTMIVLVVAFAKALPAQAQSEFKAVATYIAQSKMEVKLDSAQQLKMNSDPMLRKIMESLNKPSNQEYELIFTATESSYQEVKELAKPEKPSNGISISFTAGSGVGAHIFKNITDGTYVKKDQIMGKEFIITDKLPTYNWELHQETKTIGNFTCFKATYTPKKDLEEKENEEKENEENDDKKSGLLKLATKKVDNTITAWYTPDIQVSNGPGEFHGLPGLIIEVKQGITVILLQSIEVNPKKELKIVPPKGGKKISQADFDELQEKKSKELMENSGSRGKESFRAITIGG